MHWPARRPTRRPRSWPITSRASLPWPSRPLRSEATVSCISTCSRIRLPMRRNNEVDFHRFVLFLDHEFNDRLRFASELEVEHAVSGDDEPGEVELEQAYVEYDWADKHSLKAGLFLVPVGIIERDPRASYLLRRRAQPGREQDHPDYLVGGRHRLQRSFRGRPGATTSRCIRAWTPAPTATIRARRPAEGRQGPVRLAGLRPGVCAGWALPGLELSASVQYQDDVTQESDPLAGSAMLLPATLSWQYDGFGLRALYARWDLDGARAGSGWRGPTGRLVRRTQLAVQRAMGRIRPLQPLGQPGRQRPPIPSTRRSTSA